MTVNNFIVSESGIDGFSGLLESFMFIVLSLIRSFLNLVNIYQIDE